MYGFVCLLVLCLALSASGTLIPRIVGGADAPIGGYPYQVSIRVKGKHSCGGSVVGDRYVLSAAHCFMGMRWRRINQIKIHVGTNHLDQSGEVYDVEEVIRHNDFSIMDARNDIALVRVARDFKFTDKVQKVPIATTNFAVPGDIATVSGWGTLSFGGKVPNNLQELDVEIVGQETCRRIHRRVTDSQICTSTRGRQGACHGDSGGPLVVNGIQIGIVSYGIPCARGIPDVYTRVFAYHQWVHEHMH